VQVGKESISRRVITGEIVAMKTDSGGGSEKECWPLAPEKKFKSAKRPAEGKKKNKWSHKWGGGQGDLGKVFAALSFWGDHGKI